MTIPEPPVPEIVNTFDYIRDIPNDNTDGTERTECDCGHAKADHHPSLYPDPSKPSWQCSHCGCTQAYPAVVPSTS